MSHFRHTRDVNDLTPQYLYQLQHKHLTAYLAKNKLVGPLNAYV